MPELRNELIQRCSVCDSDQQVGRLFPLCTPRAPGDAVCLRCWEDIRRCAHMIRCGYCGIEGLAPMLLGWRPL